MLLKSILVLLIPFLVAACGPKKEVTPAERVLIFTEIIETEEAKSKQKTGKGGHQEKKDHLFEPYFELGKAYHELKNDPKALEHLKLARRFDNAKFTSRQGHQMIARILYADKKFEDAETLLKEALEAKPGDTGILSDLGAIYLAVNREPEAIETFEQALAVDSRHANALNGLGSAYLKTGQTEQAIDAFEKALSVNPRFAEARNNLAAAYDVAGKYGEAIDIYEKLLAEDPKNKAARYNLGAIYIKQGEFQKAEAELKVVAAAGDKETRTYIALGMVYEKLLNPAKAQNAFNQAIQLDPLNPDLYRQLGNYHYKNKNTTDAIAAYKKVVKLAPKDNDGFLNLSSLYDKTNDGMSAARYLIVAERNAKEANNPEQAAKINELLQAIYKKYTLKPENIVVPLPGAQDF